MEQGAGGKRGEREGWRQADVNMGGGGGAAMSSVYVVRTTQVERLGHADAMRELSVQQTAHSISRVWLRRQAANTQEPLTTEPQRLTRHL